MVRRIKEEIVLTPVPGFEPKPNGNTRGNPGVPVESNTGARLRKMDFEGIIGFGENITGFEGQDANGTTRAGNRSGHNQQREYTMPEAAKVGPWKNGNRSGE